MVKEEKEDGSFSTTKVRKDIEIGFDIKYEQAIDSSSGINRGVQRATRETDPELYVPQSLPLHRRGSTPMSQSCKTLINELNGEGEGDVDSENNCEVGEATNYRNRVNQDTRDHMEESDGDIVLNVGQTFDTIGKFRDVLQNYAFQEGFQLKPVKSSPSVITRKCRASDCPWRIYASLIRGGEKFAIKTLNSKHTCARLGKNHGATSPEIALRKNRDEDVVALQEEVTITPDKVSSTPSTGPQEPTPSTNYQGQKQNSKRKRDYGDQSAAHMTHASVPRDHVIDGQNHPAVDDVSNVNSRSSAPDVDLPKILDAINDKYGDITKKCPYESDYMKTFFALGICKVVQDLQRKSLKDVDVSTLDSYYKDVRDAERLNLNVQWLRKRLDEIKNAIRLVDDAKGLLDEKNRRMEHILIKEKELELRQVELNRINSEIRDIKDQLAKESVMVEELNTNIGARESEYSRFQQQSSLMDRII